MKALLAALLFSIGIAFADTTNVTCTCTTNVVQSTFYSILPTTDQAWLKNLTNFVASGVMKPTNNVPRFGLTNINGFDQRTIDIELRPGENWKVWVSFTALTTDYFSKPVDAMPDGKTLRAYISRKVTNCVAWAERVR